MSNEIKWYYLGDERDERHLARVFRAQPVWKLFTSYEPLYYSTETEIENVILFPKLAAYRN